MVKQTQTIHRFLPTNCLSVFDNFVWLVLKSFSLSETTLAVKCEVEALEHFLCIHACPGFEKLVPIFLNCSNAANTLKYLQILPGITFTHKQDLSWCKKFWVEECELLFCIMTMTLDTKSKAILKCENWDINFSWFSRWRICQTLIRKYEDIRNSSYISSFCFN